ARRIRRRRETRQPITSGIHALGIHDIGRQGALCCGVLPTDLLHDLGAVVWPAWALGKGGIADAQGNQRCDKAGPAGCSAPIPLWATTAHGPASQAAAAVVIDPRLRRSHLKDGAITRGRGAELGEPSMTETRQDAARDFIIDQKWEEYGETEHEIWRTLFERQRKLLAGRACRAFLEGLDKLGVAPARIHAFRRLRDILEAATGWRIVAVPGLVPDGVFFAHLASRRFPSTCFIRRHDQLDYLQEPDVFHDICGHVPLLMN